MSSEWGAPKISTPSTSGSHLIWGTPHSLRTLQKAKYPLEWALQNAKCPLEWALQKQNAHSNGRYKSKMPTRVRITKAKCPLECALQNAKCPLEWAFCFLKCTAICGGQIPLDNVPSSYPEKIMLVIEEED